MKKTILFGLLIIAIMFLSSCQQQCPDCVCGCPECPTLDCNSCPAQTETVYKNTTVVKYVCQSGEVVDEQSDCLYAAPSDIELVKDNEEGTDILETSIVPACVYGNNGGAIYFKRRNVPLTIEYQLKEGDEFKTVYSRSGVYEKTEYFAVCNTCSNGAFKVLPNKVYVFRIKFNIRNRIGGMDYEDVVEYSNEYLIDTTSKSDIMMKDCG